MPKKAKPSRAQKSKVSERRKLSRKAAKKPKKLFSSAPIEEATISPPFDLTADEISNSDYDLLDTSAPNTPQSKSRPASAETSASED